MALETKVAGLVVVVSLAVVAGGVRVEELIEMAAGAVGLV